MNFSKGGSWGIGVYFALNSKYSDEYSYKSIHGAKQMFFAKV
jgi:hypothetical protein